MYKRVNELLGTNFKADKEINWYNISEYQFLSEEFIREFMNYVNWSYISMYQKLSESFIREFEDYVDWNEISYYQDLSESFIREFSDKVNWVAISSCQVLSEEFIGEFKDEVDWEDISIFQLLSWEFILKFEDFVDWECISNVQPFINPNHRKIKDYYFKFNALYKLYQQTKDKDWFFGYINRKRERDNYSFSLSPICYEVCDKAKIYWKDLVMIRVVRNFELIRKAKYV